jgi:hypothetical protein
MFQGTLFCTWMIEFTLSSDTDVAPMVITDVNMEDNYRFIPLGLKPKVDSQAFTEASLNNMKSYIQNKKRKQFTLDAQQQYPYFRGPRYNAGRLFTNSFFTSLAINSIFQSSLNNIVQNISDTMQLVEIPPRFHYRK